jgi:hypothetical protein
MTELSATTRVSMAKKKRKRPKASPAQRAKMYAVMHEYKKGTLRSGSRKRKHRPKVMDRKQAIAIGLSQSGQSKYQSKKQKKKALRKLRYKR